jgi:hypothetical protein
LNKQNSFNWARIFTLKLMIIKINWHCQNKTNLTLKYIHTYNHTIAVHSRHSNYTSSTLFLSRHSLSFCP